MFLNNRFTYRKKVLWTSTSTSKTRKTQGNFYGNKQIKRKINKK